jgi:CRP-like cAMP-binding protein
MLRASDMLAELDDRQIAYLGHRARFEMKVVGDILIKKGEPGHNFYFIMEGQVRLIDEVNGRERIAGYLFEGDFGGEFAFLIDGPQPATEEVAVDATLAVFDKDSFDWLVRTASKARERLKKQETFFEKEATTTFRGQQAHEVVVEHVGRHFVAFLAHLPGSILLMIMGVATAIFIFNFTGMSRYLLISGCFVGLGFLAALYVYVDWRNDDFIITSERAIHIERILLHGETRHEAPLTSIQDVSVIVPGFLAKIFDYSDLHIQTAGAGTFIFDGLGEADRLRDEIFKQRHKAQERKEAADVRTIRQTLQDIMEAKVELKAEEGSETAQEELSQPVIARLPNILSYYVPRVKEVHGDVITWRKNHFVFLKLVLWPLLNGLVVGYLLLAAQFGYFPFQNQNWTVTLILLLISPLILLWYTYQYDRWLKDEYRVTPTSIIDYEGSAFNLRGERRRVGTFDVIQNSTYLTPNFMAKFLNIGHVVIETAGTEMTFTFKWVYNPAEVQQEVFNRWLAYKESKIQQDRSYEEKRFARWLGEYYHLVGPDRPVNGQPGS